MSRVALASETSLRFGATVFQQVAATGQRRRNIVAWDRLTSLIDHLSLGDSMAYRRSRGKMNRKLQPAVMQISLVVPSGESYVDLALCASILNRRGYKQECTTWGVQQFEVFQAAGAGTGLLRIDKLPETWVMDNAYVKSKALWNKMNDQVLDTEPGIEGKYADFKIGMDANHCLQTIQDSTNVGGTILTPQVIDVATGLSVLTTGDYSGAVVPVANWDFAKLQIPNEGGTGITTEFTMHAVGDSTADSKGLIQGYQLSRSRPNYRDPNVPITEGWMNELFDDGEQLEDIRDDLNADNDQAPYPVGTEVSGNAFYVGGPNELPGLQTHSFCNFTTTTVSGKNSIMGGVFSCGLMKLTNSTDSVLSLIIHMIPGNHRGYMVEVDN